MDLLTDVVLPDHQLLRRPAQHVGRVIQDPCTKLQGAFLHSLPGHETLAGCIGAGVKGSHVRILCRYDVHLVHRDPGRLSSHLRKDRIRPLPDLRCAQFDLDRSILIQDHPCAGGLKGNRIDAHLIHEDRHSHPAAHRACLIRIRSALLVPVNEFRAALHAFLQAVGIVGDAIAGHKPRGDAVIHAEFQGVKASLRAQVIRQAVCKECGLGNAVGTHRAGHRR